jgi:hypothetical protein
MSASLSPEKPSLHESSSFDNGEIEPEKPPWHGSSDNGEIDPSEETDAVAASDSSVAATLIPSANCCLVDLSLLFVTVALYPLYVKKANLTFTYTNLFSNLSQISLCEKLQMDCG